MAVSSARVRLALDALSKNQVAALPGSPPSGRPRHPAPYLQSLGLPKEGQRPGGEAAEPGQPELGTGG